MMLRALVCATALALALPVQAQHTPAFQFSDAARADYPEIGRAHV